jgi:hypothetical protein
MEPQGNPRGAQVPPPFKRAFVSLAHPANRPSAMAVRIAAMSCW